eukprot:3519165-Alexandrium_andersonii.AAC.1
MVRKAPNSLLPAQTALSTLTCFNVRLSMRVFGRSPTTPDHHIETPKGARMCLQLLKAVWGRLKPR